MTTDQTIIQMTYTEFLEQKSVAFEHGRESVTRLTESDVRGALESCIEVTAIGDGRDERQQINFSLLTKMLNDTADQNASEDADTGRVAQESGRESARKLIAEARREALEDFRKELILLPRKEYERCGDGYVKVSEVVALLASQAALGASATESAMTTPGQWLRELRAKIKRWHDANVCTVPSEITDYERAMAFISGAKAAQKTILIEIEAMLPGTTLYQQADDLLTKLVAHCAGIEPPDEEESQKAIKIIMDALEGK